jgi:predicted RNA-binding Zn-ribbon protein involved in translation (DUF1610 family)
MANDKIDEKKGPRGYRFLVTTLNIVLALLLYWLLGFLMNDISDQPGPVLEEIQKKYQDPVLVKQKETFNKQFSKLSSTIEEHHQQQTILQTSINSYRDTMNQLLDLQKASIQKGMTFSPESQNNLQNVTNLYLDYQKRFQNLNSSITKDNLEVQQLQNKIKEIDDQLSIQNEKAYKEYNDSWIKHNWAMAGLQLLVLIPLLLITAYLFKSYRHSIYKPMIVAAGVAVFLKIAMVMHEYFPSYIFKYLLILALLYITAITLISMLRMIAAPKPDWLQKQYREAYQKLLCPICQFSIKPSITKFFPTENKNIVPMSNYSYLDKVDAYTCPSCGESLFEKCTNCSHVRHSLLMYCDYCGIKKEMNYDVKG